MVARSSRRSRSRWCCCALGEASTDELTVRIGHENQVEGFAAASVVSVGYGEGDTVVAQLGSSVRPGWTIPARWGPVRAVARYVGRILAEA